MVERPDQERTADPSGGELDALYAQLRAVAQSYLRDERRGHTLQATALVHEAWLRLLAQRRLDWSDPGHVRALAARMMRRILVDYARAHGASKRGGDGRRLSSEVLSDRTDPRDERAMLKGVDLLALEEALERLGEVDTVQVRVVELRFFADMPLEQIAGVLGVSRRSVDRSWAGAQAWLFRELAKPDATPPVGDASRGDP